MLPCIKIGKLKALVFFISGFMLAQASYRQQAGDVVIVAQFRDSLIVRELAGFANEAQNINEKFFSHHLEKTINVYLTASEEEFLKFGNTQIPEWSSGIAFINQHIIVLKPGLFYDPVQYRQTLIHEITHIYIGEVLNQAVLPVWLNEGTAMYLSGKSLSWQENIVLGNAMAANKLLDLAAVDSLLSFVSAKATLAYLESYLAVRFLVERHGEKELAEILYSISKDKSLDQAFIENLGYDFFDFEIMWFESFKNQFRWIAFLQFENLFFLALVVIIMLAFVARKFRNRKIYKRWEEEDFKL